jgi:hypothetical protein
MGYDHDSQEGHREEFPDSPLLSWHVYIIPHYPNVYTLPKKAYRSTF